MECQSLIPAMPIRIRSFRVARHPLLIGGCPPLTPWIFGSIQQQRQMQRLISINKCVDCRLRDDLSVARLFDYSH